MAVGLAGALEMKSSRHVEVDEAQVTSTVGGRDFGPGEPEIAAERNAF
jgi:hypothetical protein